MAFPVHRTGPAYTYARHLTQQNLLIIEFSYAAKPEKANYIVTGTPTYCS